MRLTKHASAVSFEGQGVLINGASGSGKSSLALELIERGATLISDDQTLIERRDGIVELSAPSAIQGQIEARGIGILRAPYCRAPLALVIDLTQIETDRLPESHYIEILGHQVVLLKKTNHPAWPFVILHYLKHGRIAP